MTDEQISLLNQLMKEFEKSYKEDFNKIVNLSDEKDYVFLNNFMKDIKIKSCFSDANQLFSIDRKKVKKYGKDYLIYSLRENLEFNRKFYFNFHSNKLRKQEIIIIKKIFNSLYKSSFLIEKSLMNCRKRQDILSHFNISSINFGDLSVGFYLSSSAIEKNKARIVEENNIFEIISCLNKVNYKYLKENIALELENYIKSRKRNFFRKEKVFYKEWLSMPVSKDKMDILLNSVGLESIFFHMRNSGCITNDNFLCLLKLKDYGTMENDANKISKKSK